MNLTEEQILLIAIIVLIVILLFLIIRFYLKKKNHIGKIYTTYDGITNGNKNIKKKRKVVVVDQSNDDLAISKLHEYKEDRIDYSLPDIIISPENHPSLSKDSLVENKVFYGIKDSKNSNWRTIKIDDLNKRRDGSSYNEPKDQLTNIELIKVKKAVKKETNKSKQKKKIYRLWKKHKL